ncbi:hypothetical protein E4416_05465 [Stenotrophomonas maltophilia]|nr:hypothetical protein E4418_10695 [Stenotrophomonas maltophilia]TIK73271.1 hypothetical protein E4416_05465 [Stenotrophomonas maltophilia]
MNLHRNQTFRQLNEKHPRMAWIYGRSRESVEGGVGPVEETRAAWARGMPRAGWAGHPTPVLPCAQDSANEQAATELHGRTCSVLLSRTRPANPRKASF